MSNNTNFAQAQTATHIGGVNLDVEVRPTFGKNSLMPGGSSAMMGAVIRRRQIMDAEMTAAFGPKWPQIEAFLNRLAAGVSVHSIPELSNLAETDKFKDARNAAETMANGYGRSDQMGATLEAARNVATQSVIAVYFDGEPECLNQFAEGVALAIMLADLIEADGVAAGPFSFDRYLDLTRQAESLGLCAELDFGDDTRHCGGCTQFDLDEDRES